MADPHRLTIKGKETSDTEPSPPPTLLRKMFDYFGRDPSPSLGAITVMPETLPIFEKALEGATGTKTGNALLDKAIAFLTTRYPRFASQAPIYANKIGSNTAGMYAHTGDPYVTVDPSMFRMPLSAPPDEHIANMVRTVAHEMTHARQAALGGGEALTNEAIQGVPYLERTIEQNARQAGSTAKASYLNFLKMRGQPLQQVNPADAIQNALQNYYSSIGTPPVQGQ